jgi:hypothetical protein
MITPLYIQHTSQEYFSQRPSPKLTNCESQKEELKAHPNFTYFTRCLLIISTAFPLCSGGDIKLDSTRGMHVCPVPYPNISQGIPAGMDILPAAHSSSLFFSLLPCRSLYFQRSLPFPFSKTHCISSPKSTELEKDAFPIQSSNYPPTCGSAAQ